MLLEVVNPMIELLVLGEPITDSSVVQVLVQLGRDTAMSALAFYWGIAEKLHVLLALPLPPVNINLTHSGGGMSSESQERFSFRIFCSTAYSVRN